MRFIGTNAYDVIAGSPAADLILGLGDGDTIRSGTGRDVVFAGGGNDFVANDESEAVGDTIFGGDGNDSLWGAPGEDRIFGGAGDDNLYGRDGNDLLAGGSGADLFYFFNGRDSGTDLILDFEHGVDQLNLDFASVDIVDLGSAVRIDYGAGSVILAGVGDPGQLDANDFWFDPGQDPGEPTDPDDLLL